MKFEERVWKFISKIPRGKVSTYKEISRAMKTKAYRAVGSAVGRNPDAPKCPCHRVILSTGKIGKYSGKGGKNTKIKLLKKEGVDVKNGKIDLSKYFHEF
jgi:methylated-DNA-[protein]-cysteine S-methyltransferase